LRLSGRVPAADTFMVYRWKTTYDGVHAENRGWDKLEAESAALAAISHNARHRPSGGTRISLCGSQRMTMTQKPRGKLYGASGSRTKPDGYNFDDVKYPDGSGVDKGTL